jgi:hypothetical protein
VPGESAFSSADFDRYVEEHRNPEENYPADGVVIEGDGPPAAGMSSGAEEA